jgi:hypothetical protein
MLVPYGFGRASLCGVVSLLEELFDEIGDQRGPSGVLMDQVGRQLQTAAARNAIE